MAIGFDFRFEVGKTYRLTKWGEGDFSGTVLVKREVRPADRHGTRVLVCDFRTDHGDFLGARGFVEPAYAIGSDRPGRKSELMVIMGKQPRARAYAIDEEVRVVA